MGPSRTLKKKNKVAHNLSVITVVLLALINLFPLYWMISGSFKNIADARRIPPQWIPLNPTLGNYLDLFRQTPAFRWTLNSIVISVVTTFLVCILSSMAGYAFAKRKFPLKNAIFWILMAAMMIPNQILLIPLFKLIIDFNMVDTYMGIILPTVASTFGIFFGTFLMRQFMQTIPSELIEAANIDGCSEIRIFASIMLPVCKAGVGALSIFTFVSSWNNYLWQLVAIKTDAMKTLPLGVASLQVLIMPNVGYLMAGATIASVPMIFIFLFFQKYFTEGIIMGALKA